MKFKVGEQIVCSNKFEDSMFGYNDIHIGGVYTITSTSILFGTLYYGIVNDKNYRCSYNSAYFISARKEKPALTLHR